MANYRYELLGKLSGYDSSGTAYEEGSELYNTSWLKFAREHFTEVGYDEGHNWVPSIGEVIVVIDNNFTPLYCYVGDGKTPVKFSDEFQSSRETEPEQEEEYNCLIRIPYENFTGEALESMQFDINNISEAIGDVLSGGALVKKLTIGEKTYDGSDSIEITASDLDLASALRYRGTTESFSAESIPNPKNGDVYRYIGEDESIYKINSEYIYVEDKESWEYLGQADGLEERVETLEQEVGVLGDTSTISLKDRVSALEQFTGNTSAEEGSGLTESIIATVTNDDNAVLSGEQMPFDPNEITIEEEANQLVTQKALIERLGYNSEGRSVKYNITQSGWHRILNMIRVDSGMIHFGLCSINNRQSFRDAKKDKTLMQTLGLEISGMVNLRDAQSPFLPHPIIQHYNNIFGGANDNALNDTFKITQVRIGFPKKADDGELVDIIEEDGTNRKYNPVNCYFDIYIDLKDTVETEEKPSQHAITISYYGKSNQHNCETLFSPITENLDKGLYEEELDFYNFSLSETYDIYAPNHKANYKEIVTEDIYKKEQKNIELLLTKDTILTNDFISPVSISPKNIGEEMGVFGYRGSYNLLTLDGRETKGPQNKVNYVSIEDKDGDGENDIKTSKVVYNFFGDLSNPEKYFNRTLSLAEDSSITLLPNGALKFTNPSSIPYSLIEISNKSIPIKEDSFYVTNAYLYCENNIYYQVGKTLYANMIQGLKYHHISNLIFSTNTATNKTNTPNKESNTFVPYLMEAPKDLDLTKWIYPHYDSETQCIKFANPYDTTEIIYIDDIKNWYADYKNIDMSEEKTLIENPYYNAKILSLFDSTTNYFEGNVIVNTLDSTLSNQNNIVISDIKPKLEENQIWLKPTLIQPQLSSSYIVNQIIIGDWLIEEYNSGIIKIFVNTTIDFIGASSSTELKIPIILSINKIFNFTNNNESTIQLDSSANGNTSITLINSSNEDLYNYNYNATIIALKQ